MGEQNHALDLANTTTLYVGNLSFYATEEQIYEHFSKCSEIKRIIVGLDRNQKTPCGFCVVEYVLFAVVCGLVAICLMLFSKETIWKQTNKQSTSSNWKYSSSIFLSFIYVDTTMIRTRSIA